jgi:hypothetical protein
MAPRMLRIIPAHKECRRGRGGAERTGTPVGVLVDTVFTVFIAVSISLVL